MNKSGLLRSLRAHLPEGIAFALLAFFAYHMTFLAGERGFFAFDQSLVFDGGYRVLSGQVPYKDFVSIHGCLVFLMQAAFFKMLGVTYYAFIFGAAAVNVAASFLALYCVRTLFPDQKLFSWMAGFLTAVWFYPIFGTPWHKQTGFFFALIAMVLVTHSVLRCGAMEKKRTAYCFLGGAAAFLSAMGYQAVGLLAFPIFFVLILTAYLPDIRKTLAQSIIFAAGFAACALAFAGWIALESDWSAFWTYTVLYPMNLALERADAGGWGRFAEALLMGFTSWVPPKALMHPPVIKAIPLWVRLLLLSAYAVSVWTSVRFYGSARLRVPPEERGTVLAAHLCICLIHFQYFFIASTLNATVNGLPYIGIACAIGFGLLGYRMREAGAGFGRSAKIAFVTIAIMSVFLLSWKGVHAALARKQHFPFVQYPAKFEKYMAAEKLERLKWGDPTHAVRVGDSVLNAAEIKESDVSGLLAYLRAGGKNFFIFPDHTFFYGLAGVPSPQPVLWFHKGWTYPRTYDRSLDERIVSDLIRNGVRTAVLEDESFQGTAETLSDFPLLKAHLEKNFAWAGSFGIFNVLESKVEVGSK